MSSLPLSLTFHVFIQPRNEFVRPVGHDQQQSVGHYHGPQRIHGDQYGMTSNQHRLFFVWVEKKIQSAQIAQAHFTDSAVLAICID